MSSNKTYRLGMVTVCERNTSVGCTAGSRGNTGHDLERYARRCQLFNLLSSPAENKGISTLETQHPLALGGKLDQHAADLLLRHGV